MGNKLEGPRGCDNHKAKPLNLKLTYQATQHPNNTRTVSTSVDYVMELEKLDDDDNDDDDDDDDHDDGDGGDSGDGGATLVHTVTLLTYAKTARL